MLSTNLPNVGELDPMVWARESHQVAIDYAYKGITYGGMVTDAYLEKTREEATKRIALAGYRLAVLLTRVFPPDAK